MILNVTALFWRLRFMRTIPVEAKLLTWECMTTFDDIPAQAELEPGHSGFGMRNVDLRIRLYYKKQTGLLVQSGSEGTSVSFTIPIRTREEIDNDESLSRG